MNLQKLRRYVARAHAVPELVAFARHQPGEAYKRARSAGFSHRRAVECLALSVALSRGPAFVDELLSQAQREEDERAFARVLDRLRLVEALAGHELQVAWPHSGGSFISLLESRRPAQFRGGLTLGHWRIELEYSINDRHGEIGHYRAELFAPEGGRVHADRGTYEWPHSSSDTCRLVECLSYAIGEWLHRHSPSPRRVGLLSALCEELVRRGVKLPPHRCDLFSTEASAWDPSVVHPAEALRKEGNTEELEALLREAKASALTSGVRPELWALFEDSAASDLAWIEKMRVVRDPNVPVIDKIEIGGLFGGDYRVIPGSRHAPARRYTFLLLGSHRLKYSWFAELRRLGYTDSVLLVLPLRPDGWVQVSAVSWIQGHVDAILGDQISRDKFVALAENITLGRQVPTFCFGAGAYDDTELFEPDFELFLKTHLPLP